MQGHVLDYGFGYYGPTDEAVVKAINQAVEHIQKNGWVEDLKGFHRELVLRQTYVEVFKINDTERNPFALVSDSDVDGLHELGWHYRMINNFAKYEVGQMYSCTLKDFLEFPISQCEFMIECAKRKFEHKAKTMHDAHEEQKRIEEENRRKQEKLARQASDVSFQMPRL